MIGEDSVACVTKGMILGGNYKIKLNKMQILIQVFPTAEDEMECIPENLSYKACTGDWGVAEQHLASLRKITEKDEDRAIQMDADRDRDD